MVWKFNKGAFYRTSRMLHAYLSPAAFLMLIFFAASGILLNHPDWFGADRKSHPIVLIELTETELAAILDAPDPGAACHSSRHALGFACGVVDKRFHCNRSLSTQPFRLQSWSL
ncbi:MAG: PepSY-associated TM helix domain-containing protein [Pseudomonadota bacterium]